MKKLILSAAIALFAVTAFAQSNNGKNKQREPKEQASDREMKDKKDKVKKDKSDNDDINDTDKNVFDVNQDGIFSPEEREARKADKMARKEARKAARDNDRSDDGLLNGSNDKDTHGRDVSGTARGTTLEGREKGEAVSDVARTNGRSGDRMQRGGQQMGKPAKAARPAGSRKPAAVGRKMK
jgi:hypothetical protein